MRLLLVFEDFIAAVEHRRGLPFVNRIILSASARIVYKWLGSVALFSGGYGIM